MVDTPSTEGMGPAGLATPSFDQPAHPEVIWEDAAQPNGECLRCWHCANKDVGGAHCCGFDRCDRRLLAGLVSRHARDPDVVHSTQPSSTSPRRYRDGVAEGDPTLGRLGLSLIHI